MSQKKNFPASIKAKLMNLQRERKEPFEALLRRYTLERLLFRLGESRYKDDFLLKGGLLLSIQSENPYRPTKDLDLLGRGAPTEERLSKIFNELIQMDFPEDGLHFDEKIMVGPIRAGQKYEGIRIDGMAYLGPARVPLQIDIGFGDAVLKPYEKLKFKTLLDLPDPSIYVYPLESVMAEKFHALVQLGLNTSRMKDIFDLNYLVRTKPWSAKRLYEAVHLTFTRRQTEIPTSLPLAFTPTFYEDTGKKAQWKAFSKKLYQKQPGDLKLILEALKDFWWPLIESGQTQEIQESAWSSEDWNWKPISPER